MSIFYKPSKYNGDTKQQMWMSTISDFHDSFCNCWHPFGHLLDIIFPEGHKDRDKTIREIVTRDSQCHSGGTEGVSHGLAGLEEDHTEKRDIPEDVVPDDLDDVGIEELIAAADAATER